MFESSVQLTLLIVKYTKFYVFIANPRTKIVFQTHVILQTDLDIWLCSILCSSVRLYIRLSMLCSADHQYSCYYQYMRIASLIGYEYYYTTQWQSSDRVDVQMQQEKYDAYSLQYEKQRCTIFYIYMLDQPGEQI